MRDDREQISPEDAERYRRQLRRAMFQQVAEGAVDRDVAEEIAASYGFGPLREPADPGTFDYQSLDRVYWTFGMAVAWMAWRRPEAVRECFPDYQRKIKDWVPLTETAAEIMKVKRLSKLGYVLASAKPPTVAEMVMRQRRGLSPIPGLPDPSISVEDALGLLVGELLDQSSGLVAYAVRINDSEELALSNATWDTLALSELSNALNQGTDVLLRTSSRTALYVDIRLRQADVLSIWPRLLNELRTIGQQVKSETPAAHLVPERRHSAKRKAIDDAVRHLWKGDVPMDVEMKVLVQQVSSRLERLSKARRSATASDVAIRRRLNELRALRRH